MRKVERVVNGSGAFFSHKITLVDFTLRLFVKSDWISEDNQPAHGRLSAWARLITCLYSHYLFNRSIAAGVEAVPADADVVIVHDAVRPFVDELTLARVALAAHAHGAGK